MSAIDACHISSPSRPGCSAGACPDGAARPRDHSDVLVDHARRPAQPRARGASPGGVRSRPPQRAARRRQSGRRSRDHRSVQLGNPRRPSRRCIRDHRSVQLGARAPAPIASAWCAGCSPPAPRQFAADWCASSSAPRRSRRPWCASSPPAPRYSPPTWCSPAPRRSRQPSPSSCSTGASMDAVRVVCEAQAVAYLVAICRGNHCREHQEDGRRLQEG